MCRMECFGDQYRGCGTGITFDCGAPTCKLSSAHMHKTAQNCGCITEYTDYRRVRNLFQTKCENCQAEDYACRTGRHW